MKISRLIYELAGLLEDYGDIEVVSEIYFDESLSREMHNINCFVDLVEIDTDYKGTIYALISNGNS